MFFHLWIRWGNLGKGEGGLIKRKVSGGWFGVCCKGSITVGIRYHTALECLFRLIAKIGLDDKLQLP